MISADESRPANPAGAPRPTFRFAPSPNGRLHLGHAYSALLNADLAARVGGRVLLRIEDIDPARSRPELVDAILSDLAWLGLSFERPVRRQSQHMPAYRAALDRLIGQGLAYPCFCSRGDVRAATEGSAPRDPDGSPLYPGTCRGLAPETAAARRTAGQLHAWRLDMARAIEQAPGPHGYTNWARVPPPAAGEGDRRWHSSDTAHPEVPQRSGGLEGDLQRPLRSPEPSFEAADAALQDEVVCGMEPSAITLSASGGGEGAFLETVRVADPARWGDVVIARRDVPTSYHLAVVVDDAHQGVTHVVRGRDLEAATDLHVLLQALLGLPTPRYHHHALILGPDGEKLAKSKASESLADLRARGEGAAAVRAALGYS